MRRLAFFFCAFIVFFFLSPSSIVFHRVQAESNSLEIDRLVGLCKLWGYIKYFHPQLAYRSDIDWDAALVMAIPNIRGARNTPEYAAALQEMLDTLGDSVTHININTVLTPTHEDDNNPHLTFKLTKDGILIVTVGNYYDLWSQACQEKLKALPAEVQKAKAIVFDLRSPNPIDAFGKLEMTSSLSQIERLIFSEPILTAGERSPIHRGFENSSPFSSGQYKSGLYIQNVKRITPAPNAREIPSIFLINKNSALLDSTIALQAAGKALIVADGNIDAGSIIKTEVLDLGEGISAQVRLVEPIFEDSTSGDLQPDVVISELHKDSDVALGTALRLAGNFKPSNIVRRRLPSSAATVFDKPYSQMNYPSLEYRLLAAFRIWNIVYYFYPYKNLMEEDWDVVLRQFIPKFEQSKNALEYSLTVAEMMTHIHDSHAFVSGDVLNEYFGTGYPPIRVRLIENSLVVTHFYSEVGAKPAGLEIGDIVLKVDGEDAKARLERYAKYISASTPQSNIDKASLSFMNGKDNSIVKLTIRDRANRVKEINLPRKFEDYTTLYHRERSDEIIKLLPGNIGYVDLDRLSMEMVDDMLERFKDTRAIIFDMRGYPNGVFGTLPQRLTEKPNIAAALIETPLVGQLPASASESFLQRIFPAVPGKWRYTGKTVMLIDERSMSQAEHTGLFLRAANGTTFIGNRTAGANGEITTFSVPGGIRTGFSGQSVKFPDGRQLQRIGLVPDVEIKPTIKGIRAGRDEVLESAIKYILSEK